MFDVHAAQANPLGKIPVLFTPAGALFESNSICRYLATLPEAKATEQLYPTPTGANVSDGYMSSQSVSVSVSA